MQQKKILPVIGALLVITGLFLPAISYLGMNSSIYESAKGSAYFYIIAAVIVMITAIVTLQKWTYILSSFIGLIITLFSLKYYADAKDLEAKVGSGIWILLIGGVCIITGSMMNLKNKKKGIVKDV